MKNFLKYSARNWQTTVPGLLTFLSGVPYVTNVIQPLFQPIAENPPTNKWGWINMVVGLGLAFAKVQHVTGGSTPNAR